MVEAKTNKAQKAKNLAMIFFIVFIDINLNSPINRIFILLNQVFISTTKMFAAKKTMLST